MSGQYNPTCRSVLLVSDVKSDGEDDQCPVTYHALDKVELDFIPVPNPTLNHHFTRRVLQGTVRFFVTRDVSQPPSPPTSTDGRGLYELTKMFPTQFL